MTVRKSSRLIYGVGINDSDYIQQVKETIGRREDGGLIQKVVWVCPFYRAWSGMLQRCFSENWKQKYPTYTSTTCVDEWKYFSNFKRWMEQQPWEGNYLDKDILVQGNQTYGPKFCAFLPQKINALLISCTAAQGIYPIGVTTYSKCGFSARVQDGYGNRKELGVYSTPEEAHKAWQLGKADAIEAVISQWKFEVTYRKDVEVALLNRAQQLRKSAEQGLITTFL